MPALDPIARERFRATRFGADPGFPRERVDALYGAWLQRGFDSPGRRVWVTDERTGFLVTTTAARARGRSS